MTRRLALTLGVAWVAGMHAATAQMAVPIPAPTEAAVTAAFTEEPPRIDGHLDDPLWDAIAPVTVFTQVWPATGAAATEDTEVRIAYDRDYLYFAFTNHDRDAALIRARNLERGGPNSRDDHIFIGLDTYLDGRNAYLFEMNALGTQDDALVTDEDIGFDSFTWDAVFLSEGQITDAGWTMEVAIPFNQLRFPEGAEVDFGLMLSRGISRKNERVMWPAIGLDRGSEFLALATVSQYGLLRGLRGIRRGRNLEIKPYGISGVQQSRPDLAEPTSDPDVTADVGLDVKWGVTS
ncbi:MAG: carbohydrate binding family 9 domain-containing protein, partial [Bacteroidota bacterium]